MDSCLITNHTSSLLDSVLNSLVKKENTPTRSLLLRVILPLWLLLDTTQRKVREGLLGFKKKKYWKVLVHQVIILKENHDLPMSKVNIQSYATFFLPVFRQQFPTFLFPSYFLSAYGETFFFFIGGLLSFSPQFRCSPSFPLG